MDKKRMRTANFSREQVDLLLDLITKYKYVIENKTSDAVTWKEKDKIWNKIESEFNSATGEIRTAKCLRNKYEIIKKSTRKKCAVIRQNMLQTGGGPAKPPVLDPVEEKVKSLILISVEGLQNPFDSDNINISEAQNEINIQESEKTVDIDDIPIIFEDVAGCSNVNGNSNGTEVEIENNNSKIWNAWNPAILKPPVNKSLKSKIKTVANNRILHENYSDLAKRKLLFIDTKEELLKKEYEERKVREEEKHKLEIELLTYKIELKKKKLNEGICHCKK